MNWVSALLCIAVGVAGCSSSDAESGTQPTSTAAPTTSTTTTSTTTPTTTTTTTTTTLAPTTTVDPGAGVVSAACDTFETAGFETRRTELDGVADAYAKAGGTRDAFEATAMKCADALTRTSDAVALREEVEFEIDFSNEGGGGLSGDEFTCADGEFGVTTTNGGNRPLGLHVGVALSVGEGPDVIESGDQPIVVWSLAPGAIERVTGTYEDVPGLELSCRLMAAPFDADPGAADASLADPTHPELTGDDPATWLPALLTLDREALGSGDHDMAATTRDLRAWSYEKMLDDIDGGTPGPEVGIIEICENGRSQLDADHLSFIYLEQTQDDLQLRHAIVRRGGDGQWRFLTEPVYYGSRELDTCATVDSDPS